MFNKTKRVCASCLNFNFKKTLKVNNKHEPKWLHKKHYLNEFINNYKKFKINYPKNYTNKLKFYINNKYANRKILYWGAEPSNTIYIKDAKTAYNKFSNSGVALIDKDGFVEIKFEMPQNYKTIMKNHTKIQSFFKHIHFVISSINNDYWKKQIFTKLVHNNYKYHKLIKLLKSKEAIILNVLPCDIYAKDHIPNTYNLPYKDIQKMKTNEINNWIKSLIDLHYSKLKKMLNSNKIELYEVPIICYCAHSKCTASIIGCENLMKKGFVNVSLYEDGMKGYKENT